MWVRWSPKHSLDSTRQRLKMSMSARICATKGGWGEGLGTRRDGWTHRVSRTNRHSFCKEMGYDLCHRGEWSGLWLKIIALVSLVLILVKHTQHRLYNATISSVQFSDIRIFVRLGSHYIANLTFLNSISAPIPLMLLSTFYEPL